MKMRFDSPAAVAPAAPEINAVRTWPADRMAIKEQNGDRQERSAVRFGPFRLDRQNASLTRDGQPLLLTPKAFDLLGFFTGCVGQLLDKETLLSQIWPSSIVTDATLSVCIAEIRKVLDDSARAPRYIATVHKRGFRFICPVAVESLPANRFDIPKIERRSSVTVVGREEPLERMNRCLNEAWSGRRQLVFVAGEPGIGKTTMVETFLKQVERFPDVWCGKGQCIEHYGTGEAYLPVLDAIGELARTNAVELSETLNRLAPSWLDQFPMLRQQNGALPAQAAFGQGSERMQREIADALEALSANRLLILVLEDLHWSDYATVDLVSYLARRSGTARLLIIVTYRMATAAVQKHPIKTLNHDLQLRSQCTTLALELLRPGDIAAYVEHRYPEQDFPPDFSTVVYRHSDGNPLFMINLLHFLQTKGFVSEEQGQWRLRNNLSELGHCISNDLSHMINRQIDQLPKAYQTMLEAASVASEPGGIAVQFTLAEVVTVTGIDEEEVEAGLDHLAGSGLFLQGLGRLEWPDGTESNCYEFCHALYQNVLYERIGVNRKIRQHHGLGLLLEQHYGAKRSEIAKKLAVHFELGRAFFKAVDYLMTSAKQSVQRHAGREAAYTLTHAENLLAKLPKSRTRLETELSVLLQLGPLLTASEGNAAPDIERCYLKAKVLCDELDAAKEKFRVLFGLRSFYTIRGEWSKAERLAHGLMDLAEDMTDPDALIAAHAGLANSHFFAGDYRATHRHALQGIELYTAQPPIEQAERYGLDSGVFCYARAGQTAWALGFPDQALDFVETGLNLAKTLAHPYSLVFAVHNQTLVHLFRRDGQAAEASARLGKTLALAHGFNFLTAWSYYLSAWAHAMIGEAEQARAEIDLATTAPRPDTDVTESYLALFLAEAYRCLGDYDSAFCLLESPCSVRCFEIERLYLQGDMILAGHNDEDCERGERILLDALRQAREQGLKSYELRIGLSLGRFWEKKGLTRDRFDSLKVCLESIDVTQARMPESRAMKQLLQVARVEDRAVSVLAI